MLRNNLLAAAMTVILASLVAPAVAADEPISIGTRRELFVDSFLIEKLEGAGAAWNWRVRWLRMQAGHSFTAQPKGPAPSPRGVPSPAA